MKSNFKKFLSVFGLIAAALLFGAGLYALFCIPERQSLSLVLIALACLSLNLGDDILTNWLKRGVTPAKWREIEISVADERNQLIEEKAASSSWNCFFWVLLLSMLLEEFTRFDCSPFLLFLLSIMIKDINVRRWKKKL